MAHYDLECPYCGDGLDVNHDDGFGYREDVKHEMQCSTCDKYFVFETSISYDYEPSQADCLNGEPHKEILIKTYPTEYSKIRCKDCGETRECTPEERLFYKLDE